MKKQLLASAIALSTVTLATLAQSNSAQALTFGFSNIPPTNSSETVGDGLVNFFSLDVTDAGSGNVQFKFNYSNQATTGFISDIYFDSPTSLLSSGQVNQGNSGTVTFDSINSGGTLPQGNNLIPPFTSDFFTRAANGRGCGGNVCAIQPGETLGILFAGNYSDVINFLNSGALRVGLHVQGIGTGGGSDSFVTKAIPTPALLPGLVALGLGVLRKRKDAEASETEA